MSETEGSGGATRPKSQDEPLDEEIFRRDLNEVHLLIDFISSLPGKSLNDLNLPDPSWVPANQQSNEKRRVMDTAESIVHISRIRFPPAPEPKVRAENAALLLLAKDRLNDLARPTRGRSIAYTTMFAAGISKRKGAQGQEPSRLDLAQRVCPELVSQVRRFRWFYICSLLFVFAWLIFTALCYWDVALGDSILQHVNQLDQEQSTMLRTIPNLLDCANQVGAGSEQNSSIRVSCLELNKLSENQQRTADELTKFSSCSGWTRYLFLRCWSGSNFVGRSPESGSGPSVNRTGSPTSAQSQTAGAENRPESAGAAPAQQRGTESAKQTVPAGQHATAPSEKGDTVMGEQASLMDASAIAAVLFVFSTYILPMMFGLLGTLVAALRSVHDKIRDNLLAPRDLLLTLTSLPIGAIAGLSVGLFFRFQGGSVSGSSGLSGAVSLGAAGLAFLAGYAADAFFSFLDSVRSQVFKATNPPPGSDAAAYRTEPIRASASSQTR
jgi:hypothetical protein